MAKRQDYEGTFYKDGPYHVWAVVIDGNKITRKSRSMETLKAKKKDVLAYYENAGFLTNDIDSLTIPQIVRRHIEENRERLKPKTIQGYEQYNRLYIEPHLASVKVRAFSESVCEKWLKKLKQLGKAPQTRTLAFNLILTAIGKRRAQALADVERPGASEPVEDFLLEEQFELLMTHLLVGGYRDAYAILWALSTGHRVNELAAVRIPDVDVAERMLVRTNSLYWHPRKKFVGKNGIEESEERAAFEILSPKTKMAGGAMPLTGIALQAFEKQMEIVLADKEALGEAYEDLGFLFATKTGRPVRDRNINRTLYNASEAVNDHIKKDGLKVPLLNKPSAHDIRRTYITHVCAREENLMYAAQLARHTNIAMTQRYYARAIPIRKREAADKFIPNIPLLAVPLQSTIEEIGLT